jgi:hypothetical protein
MTQWLVLYGLGLWVTILGTLYFIDANAQLWHPLTEGYKFTSFCNANRVCMCLVTSTILDIVGGTSLATPSIWFSVYINCCTLAVEL